MPRLPRPPGSSTLRPGAVALGRPDPGPDLNSPEGLIRAARDWLGAGDDQRARLALDRALALRPRAAEALLLRGLVDQRRGDLAAAAEWFRRAIRARKDFADAHLNLGSCLIGLGQTEEALRQFGRAVALAPGMALAHLNLAQALLDQGDLGRARSAIDRARALAPDALPILLARARILAAQEDYEAAGAAWEDCVARAPGDVLVLNDAANFLLEDNRVEDSLALYRRAVALAPTSQEVRKNLIRALMTTGALDEAEAEAVGWLGTQGEDPRFRRLLGDVLVRAGRFPEARSAYVAAWDALPEDDNIPLGLTATGKMKSGEALGDRILERWTAQGAAGVVSADIAYAAGKVLDDRQDYDGAFAAFAQANRLKAADHPFDADAHDRFVEAVSTVFTPALFERFAGLGSPSETPVLVVGLPRSGTTLVEQIIASHPQAAGAGELTHVSRFEHSLPWRVGEAGRRGYPACVAGLDGAILDRFTAHYLHELTRIGPKARRVVDKLPNNFLRLGLFALAFPKARIIHCRRDLVDTCLSLYFQSFAGGHEYRHDLVSLGRYARAYLAMMAHWRRVLPLPMLEVDYADVVADQEKASRTMLEFLGLAWDEVVLRFHKREATVATASRWQVRQPIYATSVARWRRYEQHLSPLLLSLEGKKPSKG
ncbi:tetratricopeptide repeat-containing sulfotransferase family protein [Rhodospirillum rubrum]|uniref:Sulfotransferase n=1 Tax=Rhodospirillum rubrum (strain ATCC 11170 / ATH 1.1.1 / DSM 467 / LMG 4362 / NCIMB 8255 / S1) TaxID=269796 RepID=Q2RS82_RHORT|nr:tetratricopeptide repeat-containing sulfotransferase family protein [Rhodospirillum rubrum]ABC23013.1 sulfotransferase [Rhodospirillum rubrum ATCC 11170]AEO48742.1 sulfotransferase [Rhodospirillum rubrum F11]QXG78997.1 sulfotransferase [Rhodospirillum rubrum]HCF17323.1 sulfotransferase family protein [Rhodospirillum rubrum]